MAEPAAARILRRGIKWLLLLALIAAGALAALSFARRHPQDVPWTKLDLKRPVGTFTGRKLAALGEDPALCRTLLSDAGVAYRALPPREEGPNCSFSDAVRFGEGGSRTIDLRPADVGTSCPVAAALALWEWHVVQPAARRHFGRRVAQIEHFGSYSCRRLYGREDGDWSEHATANAFDVAAFRLEGGRRVSVIAGWSGTAADAAFLREVRDGACRLFSTVLSPDYNAAHRDHLHLDQARRGVRGWRGCR
jgi:hypothetical protein